MPSAASLMIVVSWVGLGLVFIGLGSLLRRLLRAPAVSADGLLLSFWLGWVSVLFALQLWHLVLPVGVWALVTLSSAGVVGLALSGTRPWLSLLRGVRRNWPALLLGVGVVIWLSNHALGGPRHGDSGAYFIPTVRWILEYPVVPGLGNLYIPYAFNQSYFLYVAMLDVGPFTNGSHHLANGLLILLLLARMLLGAGRIVRRRCAPDDLFYALCLPVPVGQVFSVFLTSPSPDLAIVVLGIVLSGELILMISSRGVPDRSRFHVLAITWLATGAVTVKLSIAGLAGMIVPVAFLGWLYQKQPSPRDVARMVAAGAGLVMVGFLPWVTRNVVLSGCPFFPSSFAALPVEWLVSADAVQWIQKPMNIHGPLTWIRDPRWFGSRLASLGWNQRDVLLPVGVAAVAGLVTLGVRIATRSRPDAPRVPAIVLLPTLASFGFTFAMAPMPRYSGAILWILAAQTVVLACGGAARIDGRSLRIAALVGAIGVTALPVIGGQPLLRDLKKFETMVRPALTPTELRSGLVVQVPRTRQCWAAPLPCTPEPNPGLRLRRPNELGSGFRIDPAAKPGD
jgi:hypothetical protein